MFACGKKIHLKSTQAGQKQIEWHAHDGVVMQLLNRRKPIISLRHADETEAS